MKIPAFFIASLVIVTGHSAAIAESTIETTWTLGLTAKYQKQREVISGNLTTDYYSLGAARIGMSDIINAVSPRFETPIPSTARLVADSDRNFYLVSVTKTATNRWDVSDFISVSESISLRNGVVTENGATGRIGFTGDTYTSSINLVIDNHPEEAEFSTNSFYLSLQGVSKDLFNGAIRPDGLLVGTGTNTMNLQGYFYSGPLDMEFLVTGSATGVEKAVNR